MLITFLLILTLMFSCVTPVTFASASYTLTNYTYAQVRADTTSLYKTPSESDVLFYLPNSYFVMLLSNYNNKFYKVQYRDTTGYVLKSSVTPIRETPQTPYLTDVTFWVFSNDGNQLREKPTKNSTVLRTVELLNNIDYYGIITGDELVKNRGTTWYYCKYNGTFGYLYAGLCDNLTLITSNTENVTVNASPFPSDDTDYLYNLVNLTSSLKILLIVLVTLPSGIIIWLLFRKTKTKPFKKPTQKTAIKTRAIKQIQDNIDDTI